MSDERIVAEALWAGADGYLPKGPFRRKLESIYRLNAREAPFENALAEGMKLC